MGTGQGNPKAPARISNIENLTEIAEDSRVKVLAQKLIEKMRFVDTDGSQSMSLFTNGTEFRRDAEELRSRGFGAMLLLQTIGVIYNESTNILVSNKNDTKIDIDNDGIRSNVQTVWELDKALSSLNDDDERRALEEDITGMILLTCWRGVRSEVEKALRKVVDLVVNDLAVDGGLGYARALCLRDIATIFRQVVDECPDNGQCPLRRVMQDAEKGTRKRDLLLAAKQSINRAGQGKIYPNDS
ncbi:hypothetical protein J3A83DRAFT_112060 [Scleroderma citrinum]